MQVEVVAVVGVLGPTWTGRFLTLPPRPQHQNRYPCLQPVVKLLVLPLRSSFCEARAIAVAFHVHNITHTFTTPHVHCQDQKDEAIKPPRCTRTIIDRHTRHPELPNHASSPTGPKWTDANARAWWTSTLRLAAALLDCVTSQSLAQSTHKTPTHSLPGL